MVELDAETTGDDAWGVHLMGRGTWDADGEVDAGDAFVGLDDTPYGFGLINTDQGTLTTARIGLNYHFGSM